MKTPEEVLFVECNFLGRKLEGMMNTAKGIKKQSEDPKNMWHWAKDQTTVLMDAVAKVTPVSDQCQALVVSSTISALLLQCQGIEQTLVFLTNHKQALQTAVNIVEPPMKRMTNMHQAHLRSFEIRKDKSATSKKRKKGGER